MSYINQPCAKLVLRMMDLPSGNTSTTTPTYNSAGWSINMRQQSAWTNINMRDVLGGMYDKFELFNIVCTSISTPLGSTAIGSTTEDRFCMAYLSGLNFRNQGYDSALKLTTSKAAIGNINYTASSGITMYTVISPTPCTFSKSDMTTDLIITLQRNTDGANSVQGTADWNFTFCFNIYGIKDDNLSHDSGKNKQSNSFLSNNFHN